MLGTLFRILFQFARQLSILLVIYSAFARASNRPTNNSTVAQLNHWLRRRTHDRHIFMLDVIHIRARIDLSQNTINIKRISVELHIESLRQHDLKNITSTNVVFCNFYGTLIHAVRHQRLNFQRVLTMWRLNWRIHDRSRQIFYTFIYADNRCVISHVSRRNIKSGHWHAFNHVTTLAPMIKRRQRTDHAHHRVGHIAIFGWRVRQVFNFTHDVIAEKSHQAALQRRQVRV